MKAQKILDEVEIEEKRRRELMNMFYPHIAYKERNERRFKNNVKR